MDSVEIRNVNYQSGSTYLNIIADKV